jgi:hypothetical protein
VEEGQENWRATHLCTYSFIQNVPYSEHSNYQEIVDFVKSIKPSFIEPIVPLEYDKEKSLSTKGTTYDIDGNT